MSSCGISCTASLAFVSRETISGDGISSCGSSGCNTSAVNSPRLLASLSNTDSPSSCLLFFTADLTAELFSVTLLFGTCSFAGLGSGLWDFPAFRLSATLFSKSSMNESTLCPTLAEPGLSGLRLFVRLALERTDLDSGADEYPLYSELSFLGAVPSSSSRNLSSAVFSLIISLARPCVPLCCNYYKS